jgi:hypothetical protein
VSKFSYQRNVLTYYFIVPCNFFLYILCGVMPLRFLGPFEFALCSLLFVCHPFTFLPEEFLSSFSLLDLGNFLNRGQFLHKLFSLFSILNLTFPSLLVLKSVNLLHQSINLLFFRLQNNSTLGKIGLLILLLQNLGLGCKRKIGLKTLGNLQGIESSLLALNWLVYPSS